MCHATDMARITKLGMQLHPSNWRLVMLSCVLLYKKMHSDGKVKPLPLLCCVPLLQPSQLFAAELALLRMLSWRAMVTESELSTALAQLSGGAAARPLGMDAPSPPTLPGGEGTSGTSVGNDAPGPTTATSLLTRNLQSVTMEGEDASSPETMHEDESAPPTPEKIRAPPLRPPPAVTSSPGSSPLPVQRSKSARMQ